jgi:hypothetical protein
MMRPTSAQNLGELPKWQRTDGLPVSGVEKMMLDKNYHELRDMAQDALEDGILIGCSEVLMREALQRLIDTLINPYGEQRPGGAICASEVSTLYP